MQQIAMQPFSPTLDMEVLSRQEQMEMDVDGFAPAPYFSLPTVLLTTALLLLATGATFFITYFVLAGTMLASVIMTFLSGLLLLGPLGIVSAWVTDRPVQLSNLLGSIGLTLVVLFLFGICSLFGALAALVVQVLGLG